MNPLEPDDWTDREREVFRALPRELNPLPTLENRVVSELRREGLLRGSSFLIPWWAAAAAVLLVSSFVWWMRRPQIDAPQYSILLYGSPGYAPGSSADQQQRFETLRVWSQKLDEQGVLVTSMPLEAKGSIFTNDSAGPVEGSGPWPLRGLFLVRAKTPEEARALAAECPFRTSGGSVVLQAVGGGR
jgi:hypothetical protein